MTFPIGSRRTNSESSSCFGVSGWLPRQKIFIIMDGGKVKLDDFCSNDKHFGCDRFTIGKGIGKVEKLDCGNTDSNNCKYVTIPFDYIERD